MAPPAILSGLCVPTDSKFQAGVCQLCFCFFVGVCVCVCATVWALWGALCDTVVSGLIVTVMYVKSPDFYSRLSVPRLVARIHTLPKLHRDLAGVGKEVVAIKATDTITGATCAASRLPTGVLRLLAAHSCARA